MTAPGTSVALVFPAVHRRGGAERVVRELARRVATTHDVTIVAREVDADGLDGMRIELVPPAASGRSSSASFSRDAGAILARLGSDVRVSFGAECPPTDLAVVQSVHAAWVAGSAPIATPVGNLPAKARRLLPRHRRMLAMERVYFNRPTLRRVVATSSRTADEVARWYGLDRAAIGIQPNGFDHDEFHPGLRATAGPAQRTAMGATDDDIVLLFVANELHRKGFGVLLEAMAEVGDPRLRLDVVGRVTMGGYTRRLADLGLDGRVRLHGLAADVAPFYAAADLFVLPTQYEPFGNVIVEALACGLPVITTEVAGAAPAVVPGVSGLLQHDALDARELAELLRRALEPGTLASWSQGATAGLAPFDWDVVAVGFEREIDALVRG